jgi:hypothetical protein
MSSRSSAAIKAERPSKHAPGRAKTPPSRISADAMTLATKLERALAKGHNDLLTPDALQALMAAGCKAYAAQIEAGHDLLPFGKRSAVSPTDVMTTASGLLRAVNLAVFELGMWQSWTGR